MGYREPVMSVINRIEITQLTADLTLVIVKEDAEVVGASVVYNIEVPAPAPAVK